jgi:hypothetical protein
VECGLGNWVITLKDHETGLQGTLEIEVLENLLPALEYVLGAGRVAWKPFKSHRRKVKPPKDGK